MGEVIVVNLFLLVRVFLVGGIFLMFPRITRRGLFFGVYVGEEFADGDVPRAVLRSWDRGCGIVMAAALLVGLVGTLAGSAVAGNLTGTAVLLLGLTGLYFRSYSKVKSLRRPNVARQAGRARAVLQAGNPKGETFAKITLVICLLVSLATLTYAYLSYPGMGERMPTLWSLIGGSEGTTETSYLTILYAPGWNLVIAPLFAVLALMISTAKRSLRDGPGNRSAEAQEAFRSTNVYIFSGMALLYLVLLTTLSLQVVRIGRGEASSLGAGLFGFMIVMIVLMGTGLFVLIKGLGQGGSRLERGSEEGALSGGLADNDRWVGGLFYVNPDDPSIMVESRFGVGYAMNWGSGLSGTLRRRFQWTDLDDDHFGVLPIREPGFRRDPSPYQFLRWPSLDTIPGFGVDRSNTKSQTFGDPDSF